MALSFDATQTLAMAIAVLFLGGSVIARFNFLRENNIPIPVVGGILFAVVNAFFYSALDVELSFDTVLRGPLMLAFFTTIGLGADLRQLARGGRRLAVFGAVCLGYLVVQDAIGVLAALGMDLHPVVGLLSASITLSGGHGTGAAYAERFASVQNIAGTTELANILADANIENVPTCGIVRMELAVDHWRDAAPGRARLLEFDYPKKDV